MRLLQHFRRGCGWGRLRLEADLVCEVELAWDPVPKGVPCALFGGGERHCRQLHARAPSPDVVDVPLPLIPVRGKQEGGGLSGKSKAKRRALWGIQGGSKANGNVQAWALLLGLLTESLVLPAN